MALTQLDAKALKSFIENDLTDFLRDLDSIRKDDPSGVLALYSILSGRSTPETLGENLVLGIGLMAGNDNVYGQSLISKISDAGKAIDEVFVAQKKLFKDIENDLQETIDKLLKDQGGSLASIDGAKLLDIFTDVDQDLSGDGSGGGGGSNDDSSNSNSK
ncbi:type VII secretion system-associated protein [Streptomyces sp. NPDC102274]|uniref:type VII secretion system-associated protein n=1 Tax=Streptomyces sp. NPDC102274 TaxID=3366151 RepID=UPI00381DBFE8